MSRVALRNIRHLMKISDYKKHCLNVFRSTTCVEHRQFSTSCIFFKKELAPYEGFLSVKNKNKKTYLEMIDIFMARDRLRSGHLEFIYSALKHMKDFGVEKDLEVYKKLIDVFPKGKMIPRNIFQAEFMHYPKHQQCAIDLLEQMEENGVIPDWEMQDQLINVFGKRGYPVRRYWRMMYWMPRFKKASPWPLPTDMPNDTLELAKIAIERICSVDPTTEITVFQTKEISDSLEDTWIVSGQSEKQRDLISMMPKDNTLYVDGGFRLWLKDRSVTYFTLWTEHFRKFEETENADDVGNLLQKRLAPQRTIHESGETVILGVASSGTSSPDSMLSWIRALSALSPDLGKLHVLFRTSKQAVSDKSNDSSSSLSKPQEKIEC